MKTKLLLVLGPTGVGKSTVMQELSAIDSRFSYIMPFTTRAKRLGETNKISLPVKEFERLRRDNRFVAVNQLYGFYYGTPADPILQAFRDERFPMIDWPVQKVHTMDLRFPGKTYKVYLEPPSFEVLMERMSSDGNRTTREDAAKEEYANLLRGAFDGLFDLRLVNIQGRMRESAIRIYEGYISSIRTTA